jgi:hypothetical protein
VPLIKSGSLNWPWSTKILGLFVTCMCKNWLILKIIGQCDVKHILTSPIKTLTPVWRSRHTLSHLVLSDLLRY